MRQVPSTLISMVRSLTSEAIPRTGPQPVTPAPAITVSMRPK